jgi:succinoglycan biosynthesis protein ExoM
VTATLAPVTVVSRQAVDSPVASAEALTRAIWVALLLVPAMAVATYGVLGPRTATLGPTPFIGDLPATAVVPLQLLLSLAVTAVGLGVLVLAIPTAVSADQRLGRGAGVSLAVLGSVVIASGWWNGLRFNVVLVALPAVALGLAFAPTPPPGLVERLLRGSLRVVVWGSLFAAVVAPAWATGPHDSIIGLPSRLAGLTTHPNVLGFLAVGLLVLEWTRRPRSALAVASALAAVVWTESKTSWATVVVLAVVALLAHFGVRRRTLALVVLAGSLGATMTIAVGLTGAERATVRGNDGAETFTGRTAIWEATLEAWADQPVLGTGPRLWDDEMDRRFAGRVGFAPGHAHSQLIHTLGEAGLLGGVALAVALVTLASSAARADHVTRGAATAMFVVIVVSCFSEPRVRSTPYASGFFLVVATLALIVATFQRPVTLVALLDALDAAVAAPPPGWTVRVVVCDNDPSASAQDVCVTRSRPPAYLHEPRPGIAAARNALLEASAADDAVAFIDDDERPEPGWLDALLDGLDRYDADVVTGAVLSDFDVPPPAWLEPSFERPRQRTGTTVAWPRTSNVVIRRRALEDPPLRFRESYGLSGGSDSMLFLEMARRGARMVWSDEAVVREQVPSSRTNLRWVLRRSFRLGNTHTRFDRDLRGTPPVMALRALKAIGWVGTGLLRAGLSALRGDRRGVVVGAERISRGAGMVAAFAGLRFLEYRREGSGG